MGETVPDAWTDPIFKHHLQQPYIQKTNDVLP